MNIYTIGGGEIVYEVLKSVTLCLNGGGGILRGMLTIGGICSIFMVYFMILYGNIEQIIRTWALPLLLMLHMLFLPTSTVWVKDTITKYHYKIDHVPYGLAVFASNISRVGQALTEIVEQNFSLPDDLKYQKSGLMFGSNILEKSKTFKIISPNFRENMKNFVGQCVKYDIMLNGKYSFEELRNSSNLWRLITANPSPNRGIFWIPLDGRGKSSYVTCAGAVQKFNQAWTAELQKSFSLLGRQFFSEKLIGNSGANSGKFVLNSTTETALKNEIMRNIQSTAAYLEDLSSSAEEVLKQSIMINALEDSASENTKAAGNLLSYAESKALVQQNYAFETIERLAVKLLPIMKAVIEALAYAGFVFVIPLCMIPGGYKFLSNWVMILVWLQAWPPMFAVLNFIMNIAARASTVAEIGTAGGLTIANYVGVSDTNAEIKILAGYLAMSIPFICIALVKGIGTFVHLAGQMTGTSMQAASSGSAEIANGNFSYGNVSMGNTQLQNLSQLQRNFSSSLSAADHTLVSGRQQIKHGADGSHLFMQQVSSGIVNSSFDESTSIAQNMILQGVRSELRSTETALAHANGQRNSRAMDFSRQISEAINHNTTDTLGFSASEANNLQEALKVVTGHTSSDDYSQSLHSSVSFGLGVFGASISADARNAHNDSESHQSQNSMSYQKAESTVKSYANTIAHSNANSEVTSSAEKYLQSVEESDTLSARKSALEQELHSMTESISRSRSLGASTKMALQDDVREELVQSVGISQAEANRLINQNAPEARAAFEKVYDQKMQAIPSQPVAKQMSWTVGDSGTDLGNQYAVPKETAEQKEKKLGSLMNFTANDDVKQTVASKQQITTGYIESKKGDLQLEEDGIVKK
ncbi:MAG: conjugal transfer protein TraG N-terminal domain-containing protein, partial [Holosporaceae bacterium]|nr:conjugal transfer protein TraG N-terminal domain-containing protein [Holosporaceae bacterium]